MTENVEHDWHSPGYVSDWIHRDVTHDAERRPMLRRMAAILAGVRRDEEIRLLDVGGGYGVVSDALLSTLPRAQVVLHDFSETMIDRARQRLAVFGSRVSYHLADLADPSWSGSLDGHFDGVISCLAIHNLGDPALMARVYEDIGSLMHPGGRFLDFDIVFPAGPLLGEIYRDDPTRDSAWDVYVGSSGLADRLSWLRAAGFAEADCLYRDLEETLLCGVRS
jgi:tRNA (cmo5U34)-methyltransferase